MRTVHLDRVEPEQKLIKQEENVPARLLKKSRVRKKYKSRYVKPSRNYRVNPVKAVVPNTVEIRGILTVKEPRMPSWKKRTRYLRLQSL